MKHKYIVGFDEVYKTRGGKLCIVMEYCDGGDMAKRINTAKTSRTAISEDTALNWLTQMCLALKHIHDRKVIHRDIKAQNVFLMADGSLRLGDFGVARVLDYTVAKAQTQVGTPYYIAPEILKGRSYTSKVDVWSLGVLLFEMCALDVPIKAANLHDLYKRIMSFRRVPPLPRQYSSSVRELLAAMLSVDASKRPSVEDLLAHEAIRGRVDACLSSEERKAEFDHTALHGEHLLGKAAAPKPAARPFSARAPPTSEKDSRGAARPGAVASRVAGEKPRAKLPVRRVDQNKPPAPMTPRLALGARKNSAGFLHQNKLLQGSGNKQPSKAAPKNYNFNKYGKPSPAQTPKAIGGKKLGGATPVGFHKQRPGSAAYGAYKPAAGSASNRARPLGQNNGRFF